MNARDTNDLLRRFREMGERMRQEFGNSAPHLSEKEADLRVSDLCGGRRALAGDIYMKHVHL